MVLTPVRNHPDSPASSFLSSNHLSQLRLSNTKIDLKKPKKHLKVYYWAMWEMQCWKITLNHPILSKKPSGNWIGDSLILSNSDGSRAQSTGEIEEYPFINVSNFAVMSNRIYDRKREWELTQIRRATREQSPKCVRKTRRPPPQSVYQLDPVEGLYATEAA